MATRTVGIVDYGVGNLHSVSNAVLQVGGCPLVSSDASILATCDRVILPGVGAFGHCMSEVCRRGLDRALVSIAHSGKPMLGICLGMQILVETSEEFGKHCGLSLLNGHVRRLTSIRSTPLRLPNVDWMTLRFTAEEAPMKHLFDGIPAAAQFYFIHSFAVEASSSDVIAVAEFDGSPFAAVIGRQNVVGTQFHPEKSGQNGLRLIRNFLS